MTEVSMTKSELIERIVTAQAQTSGSQLTSKDVELAVKTMIEQMSLSLASGERIEIRGFGSFSLHYRAPRIGRNPKTGGPSRLSGLSNRRDACALPRLAGGIRRQCCTIYRRTSLCPTVPPRGLEPAGNGVDGFRPIGG